MTEHTKTPWHAHMEGFGAVIHNADDQLLFRIENYTGNCNIATDILSAVNAHDDLVAVLDRCRNAMVTLAALAGSEYNRGVPWAEIDAEARTALTKAGKETI